MLKSTEYGLGRPPAAIHEIGLYFFQIEAEKQSFRKLRFDGTKVDILGARKHCVVYTSAKWQILINKAQG